MSMKSKALILVMTVFLLLLVAAGCGTLEVNFHTIVKSSGDITQEIKLEGSGMLGEFIEEFETEETVEQEGWEITTKRDEDSISLIATKDFRRDESMIFGDETIMENVSSRVTDNLFIKEYLYEVNIPGGGPMSTGNEDEFAELGELMLEDMFKLSWTFTLPGKITSSNADEVEGNSATWYFDVDSFENDRYLLVQSRYINWPVIAGIGAGVLIIIGLIIFFVVRARRSWG